MKDHPTFAKVETSIPPNYQFTPPSYHGTPSLSEVPPIFNLDDDADAYAPQDMQFSTPQGVNCGTPQSMNYGTPQSVATGSASSVRQIGVKAAKEAKRKGKRAVTQDNDARDMALASIAANQKMQVEWQKQVDERQAALDERQMQLQERIVRTKEKKVAAISLADETKIMTQDMAALTPNTKKYFMKRKAAILRQYECDDEQEDTTYSNYYRPLFPN